MAYLALTLNAHELLPVEQRLHPVQYLHAHVVLGHEGKAFDRAFAVEDYDAVVVNGEAGVLGSDVIRHYEVQPLRPDLRAGVLDEVYRVAFPFRW